MKFKAFLLAAVAAATMCTSVSAQNTRVAYVDIDKVTAGSAKINEAMGKVQGRVEDIQKEIETKRARLVEIKAELKKGQGVVAETELKKKRDESTKLEKELVDLEYEGRREMQKLDTTLFEPMVKTIVLAIQDVAKEKNIDLVIRGEAVIYGANAADITEDVIKKLNSSSYNPDALKASDKAEDKESTKSSNSESTSSDSSSASADAPAADKEEAKPAASSGSKTSIFPSVPLKTRPVDRQQD